MRTRDHGLEAARFREMGPDTGSVLTIVRLAAICPGRKDHRFRADIVNVRTNTFSAENCPASAAAESIDKDGPLQNTKRGSVICALPGVFPSFGADTGRR